MDKCSIIIYISNTSVQKQKGWTPFYNRLL